MAEGHINRGWQEHITRGRRGCVFPVGNKCCGKSVDGKSPHCPYHAALKAHWEDREASYSREESKKGKP